MTADPRAQNVPAYAPDGFWDEMFEAPGRVRPHYADLAAIGSHEIVTTADARLPHAMPRGVEVVTLPPARKRREALLDGLMASADAVWLVAPETDRCLERLAAKVERWRTPLLGASANATNASPIGDCGRMLPPAAITTNCRPSAA